MMLLRILRMVLLCVAIIAAIEVRAIRADESCDPNAGHGGPCAAIEHMKQKCGFCGGGTGVYSDSSYFCLGRLFVKEWKVGDERAAIRAAFPAWPGLQTAPTTMATMLAAVAPARAEPICAIATKALGVGTTSAIAISQLSTSATGTAAATKAAATKWMDQNATTSRWNRAENNL